MASIDPFAIYGWLRVHYRQASIQPGFAEKNATGRWLALRQEVVISNPVNDPNGREAIDSIEQSKREEILAWLARG